jgi:glycosyltransferase involved in cell wall biosynthesis
MEATGFRHRVLVFTERVTYACAHKVYPNSKGLEAYIVKNLKASRHKLKIIGRGSSNGIDTGRFARTPELNERAAEIREKYDIGVDDLVFTFVGRIVRDKGIVELIEAFKSLAARAAGDKQTFLFLVGPVEEALDPLPAETTLYINENPNVILPGFQDDVRPWIAAADVFVFPSYREGFPNVVMQACLLEVPCIVTDINGCNEIITDKETGLIIPPKDSAALAAAMALLGSNPTIRTQYAAAAQAFVRNNFDREYVWRELLEEYRRMLKK